MSMLDTCLVHLNIFEPSLNVPRYDEVDMELMLDRNMQSCIDPSESLPTIGEKFNTYPCFRFSQIILIHWEVLLYFHKAADYHFFLHISVVA